jgi:hypothetical protein
MFGFQNNLSVELELKIDLKNLLFQSDIFAREMLTHRSEIDFKRFMGSFQQDWLRILSETYVYDRLKNIYYGINSKYMNSIPNSLYSFPGNTVLMNALSIVSFNFSTNDSQPFNLYYNIKYNNDINELFEPIFQICPDLKEGMSDTEGIYSYVGFEYEAVLKGLFDCKNNKLMKSKKNKNNNASENSDLYYINSMDDDTVRASLLMDSNPLLNSFFTDNFDKFYFIMPSEKSVPEALRFNESLFLSRALGFTGKQLTISDNNLYTVATVNNNVDRLIREDLYSVTGLKTEIINYSMEQIKEYLGINSYKGGSSSNANFPSS